MYILLNKLFIISYLCCCCCCIVAVSCFRCVIVVALLLFQLVDSKVVYQCMQLIVASPHTSHKKL